MKSVATIAAFAVALAASSAFAADPVPTPLSQGMQNKMDKLPADFIKKQDAAVPTEAPAKPAKARKLLVYMETTYDPHPLAEGGLAIKKMGEKTGAYEVTLTDDLKIFTPETLAQFDGIFMNNTVGDHPRTPEGKQALLDYIKAGHGFMGTHSTTDSNHAWDEYFNMLGGEFWGHPFREISVKNEDPKNPVNAAFDSKGFAIDDEIYVMRVPNFDSNKNRGPEFCYSRDKLHVLLSIDNDNSRLGKPDPSKAPYRKDADYAVSWVKTYGNGRVFYCSLGHDRMDWANPMLLKHYLAGIQYALGDLKADDTPSAKLTTKPDVISGPNRNDKDTKTINIK
jgi:type 1 glutamine amidotransferase